MDKTLRRKIQNVPAWFAANGDNTHSINHNLNENSVVMDLGGYTGVWLKKMELKYNPNLYVVEPIKKFYDVLVKNFESNKKFNSLNVGVSNENKKGVINLKGDETSSQDVGGDSIEVEFIDMGTLLKKWGLESVDLLQINIEGDEYPLLENMIETGVINKFKSLQIQFHLNNNNFQERRDNIRKHLENNNYKLKYDFPFVWECWVKDE